MTTARGRAPVVIASAALVLAVASCGSGPTAPATTVSSTGVPSAATGATAATSASQATSASPSSETPATPTSAAATWTSASATATRSRTATSNPSPSGALLEVLQEAAAKGIESAVTATLSEAGVTLSAGPDCSADLAVDRNGRTASGTVSCTGTTSTGLPMTASFVGAVGGGTCSGTLTVGVAGRPVITDTGAQSCRA